MEIFKFVISLFNISFALLMYFFQRDQIHKPTKIGFWAMILLYIANMILIWD